MVSKAILLLKSARRSGIHISVNNGELQLKLNKDKAVAIDPQLLQEIKDNKAEILDFLSNDQFKSAKVTGSEKAIQPYDRNVIKQVRLSFSQERLWFIHQLQGTREYHLPAVLRLSGKVDKAALAHALQTLVQRHEALRSVIYEADGETYQRVMDVQGWELQTADGSTYKNNPEALQQYIRQLIDEPFDLSKDYMLRATLVGLAEAEHLLVVTVHHIASDGWSLPIIINEVSALYEWYVQQRPSRLAPLPIQYSDYAVWQRSSLQGSSLQNKIAYWKEKLKTVSPLQLPTDFARPYIQSTKGASVPFTIDKKVADGVQALCHQHNATLFMVLLAVYKVLLHRYSGQNDICVGTPVAGRNQPELEDLVGFFVNTLALRTQANSEATFSDFLHEVKKTTLEAYEHQETPFEKVVEAVVTERDPSRSLIFQVMFILQNTPAVPEIRLPGLTLTEEKPENDISKFDIAFYIIETKNGLEGYVDYCTDLYQQPTILRLIEHYKTLLHSIVANPHQKIGLLPMLTSAELHQLTEEFNQQSTEQQGKTIVGLFEEQAALHPEKKAIKFEEKEISYGELNTKANQLAAYLRKKGIKEETLVPVCVERSPELIIALLGILKAGGAYVPIDADYPADRIKYMLEDTAATLIVSNERMAEKLPYLQGADVIEIDDDRLLLALQPTGNVAVSVAPQNLAYVMYTSGSTGRPKGVQVQHGNVASLVKDAGFVTLSQEDVLLSTGSPSFDATTFEYWGMLLNGGQLILCPENTLLDNALLKEEVQLNQVTKMWFTSSWFNQIVEDDITLFAPLKTILAGGEKLSEYHIVKLRQTYPHIELINGYGPTENTTFSLTHTITETNSSRPIPIGRPLNNRQVLILDTHLQPVPVGINGEICVGGAGLSRGYLNLPELTAEKFVQNPFSQLPEDRMYRTGDIGRWLPDGTVEYGGRRDEQVKIRGYRIELGEIENVLQQYDEVEQAVVLAREDKQGTKRLIGYIVSADGIFDKAAINDYLTDKLPAYMVPALWVPMENLPLTVNGKIDRRALPDPDADELVANEYVAPRTALETQLADIWKLLLDVEQVGIHDNFFELGGHSLLATRVIAAIRTQLHREIAINTLFDYPTVALLAGQLQTASAGEMLPAITPLQPRPELIPLSFGQERLWFIDRLEGSTQYHTPAVLRVKGQLNIEALIYALQTVVDRHEAVRAVFLEKDGQAYQQINSAEGWHLSFVDGAAYSEDGERLQSLIHELINKPFDLSADYLLRAELITLRAAEYVLIVTMHHIASDGWSRSVLVKEVLASYQSFETGTTPSLPPLPVQYVDYAIWQRQHLAGVALDKELNYWKNKLNGAATLQLPTDFSRPAIQSFRGGSVAFSVEKSVSQQLQQLSQQQGVTLFMSLLATFNVLLYRYSGQQDISVGSPMAGRKQQELENLIGFFVNTLVYRTEIKEDASFTELLQQVRLTTIEAQQNQDVPFEKVVDAVVKERSLSISPLAQVMFVFLNTPEIPKLVVGDVQFANEAYEHASSPFDITFFMYETPDGLTGSVEYATDLFTEYTIQRMIAHFNELLRSVAKAPAQIVGQLPMLLAFETTQLLHSFNKPQATESDNNVIAVFEQQVLRSGDTTAVVHGRQQLSFQQLNAKANQLAHCLQAKGVKAETFVPIYLQPGLDMLVAILGILKAGAAYVPIDPAYPLDRIRYLLEDTGASVVITNATNKLKLPATASFDVLEIDSELSAIEHYPTHNIGANILPHNAAYIIYTSGSTGTPKGVVVEHRNLTNYLLNANTKYINPKTNNTGSYAHLAYTFDASLTALLMPLVYGKSVVIAAQQSVDVFEDENLLKYAPYDFIKITPAHLELLQPKFKAYGKSLLAKKLVIGGEALYPGQFDSFIADGIDVEIINEYGPTEATVGCTVYSFHTVTDQHKIKDIVSIGRPIDNAAIYILSNTRGLVPTGVKGEIYIGGAGVARGYLNRPELTAERFIDNPFSIAQPNRLYKTGDQGRWLADGNIEYLGRQDDQVKIRGYRIELGEVEQALQQCNNVSQGVIVSKEDREGGKRLVSYYVPEAAAVLEKEAELLYQRVANWKELYETEYGQTEGDENIDPEFNIIGWNDSFTGGAIPAAEMREWLDDIVAVIMNGGPHQHVLEIGCGTGLIYYQLAGKINRYTGSDLSASSIRQITEQVSKGLRNYGETELFTAPAHEVSLPEGTVVDTILLNSIVQYFPGEAYMNKVIHNCLTMLNGKGRIIIGDVRDNRLQESFKARLLLNKMQPSVSLNEFNWTVDQDVAKDVELCFSPEYFYKLPSIHPEISHVTIQWKKADYINELSLYRYTVILHVGATETSVQPDWYSLSTETEQQVLEQINNGSATIALKDVPNPRLWKERRLAAIMLDKTDTNVGSLATAIEKQDTENSGINEILQTAAAKGYQSRWFVNNDPLLVNVLLELQSTEKLVQQHYKFNSSNASAKFTNIPLFVDIRLLLQKDIKTLLKQRLPEYMLPSEMVAISRIPLTNNGKADRKFLSTYEEIGILKAGNYVAPLTVLEQLLVTVWKELLGREQIGIEDNFFEIGGDSILTIQIVSRLRRLGYELQPKDIFLHQTIKKLAAAIEERSGLAVTGEQGILTGFSGLLPIQQWFLGSPQADYNHFNQGLLLSIDKAITANELQYAVEQLMDQHDALRFKYYRQDNEWLQEYGSAKAEVITEDLQSVADDILSATITQKATTYQQTFDIQKGELVKVVLMQTPASNVKNRLLMVVHHLAVDGISWRILLEDLELLLNGLKKDEKIKLGTKSSSYRQWHQALQQYGQRNSVLAQLPYWRNAAKSYQPIPVDTMDANPVTVRDTAMHTIRLNTVQTTRLLQEVPRAYHTEINDVLLAALAHTICNWSGNNSITIGLESHGREDIESGVDVTRTIGWFTSVFPVLLTMPAIKNDADIIQSIKEQLRQLPDKGLGYGVLRYINREPSLQSETSPWDIVFNYLGQLDNVIKSSNWLSVAGEPQGSAMSGEHIVGEKIAINSSVTAGELNISWSYSNRHFHPETIQQLANAYITHLEQLINHCVQLQKTGTTVFTPSDYGLGAELGYNELQRFLTVPFNGRERRDSIESLYRLSSLQEGLLFHGFYGEGVDAYVQQFAYDLEGMQLETLRQTWAVLLKRHSVLRSAFYADVFSIPVQGVYKYVVIPMELLDYRQLDEEAQTIAITAFDKADLYRGFDYTTPPLMRISLFRLTDDKYRMLFTVHHILFDGWSFPILMEEFLTTYELLSSGGQVVAKEEDRYEDYIRYIERSNKEQEEQYWRNYLKDVEKPTLLPFIPNTVERNKGVGIYKIEEIQLPDDTVAQLHQFAQRHHITVNTIMQGVWAYLLHRYTGNNSIVYGVVVSGRPDDLSGVEQRVGMYINNLPLHAVMNANENVVEWLQGIQAGQVNSRQYQHTPFTVAQGWSGVQGDLFDTLFTFENYPFNDKITTKQWTLNVSNVKMHYRTNYPLSLVISDDQHILIQFSYNSTLLQEAYVKEIRNHFENVLLQFIERENAIIGDIDLLTLAEQQLLTGVNNNHVETEQNVVRLFEEQATKTPYALAVVFGEEKLTYQELNSRSNQVAHCLNSKGVTAETLVPICLNRSIEMMVGILGILKAGAAYVPIEPDYPEERIAYMVADTGASIIISNQKSSSQLHHSSAFETVIIDNGSEILQSFSTDNLNETISGKQLAYIIYTSGSTGRPKGVMIEHSSLLNYLTNNKTKYIGELQNNTGSYIHLSYTFDASVTALFMPLLHGKALVLGSKQSIDIFEDANLLKYAPYDFIKITPSHLELLQPHFKAYSNGLLAEKLVIGGEALRPAQFNSFIEDGIDVEIINEYGPTEATVGCTVYHFQTVTDREKIQETVSIGKPIDNAGIYILDSADRLVPAGVQGEICISGAGLARGYLNRAELTAEKFIDYLFATEKGEKLYRTGDVGRWLPDGNIEYLGRQDDQVKIRGYRVELGEIEQAMQQQEAVTQAVVISKEDVHDRRLVSYYVPDATIVKSRERELNYQRVANWKELYETEYGQTEGDETIDPEFNIIGWNDSFTGGAIPAADMKEWLDDIVSVILADKPKKVLEIGCGTGLIYYQLAGKVDKYIGSDLSRSSINQIKERISKGLRNYGETELFTAPAHGVELPEGEHVDTILLNSIVQYFPGEDYMNAVMEKCMTLINGKGRIIIGDVRDNRLLSLFKGRLRLQKSADSATAKDFKWGLEQDLIKEEELCFTPAYFYGLQQLHPQISQVEIVWKKADYENELSLYRYTAILYVGKQKATITPQWQSWNDVAGKQDVFSGNRNANDSIALQNVPNPRLWKERLLQQAMQDANLKTVREINNTLENEDGETARINKLLQLAESKGYQQKWFVNDDPLLTNLLFEMNPADGFVQQPSIEKIQYRDEAVTNIPLFTDISFLLQKDIRQALASKLPEYMVPADLITLRQLPLTTNGKVDRLFLSRLEDRVLINTLDYVAPTTELEITIANIWKDLLHLEQVGIEDNFFDLGGHSLLAMRVISTIRKQLEVELNIKELFVHPTIASLSAHIQKLSKGLLLPAIVPINPQPEKIPLSFSQERMWFIHQLDGSLQYHMPAILRLQGHLDKVALSNALQQIINRHEVLRTVILDEKGQGYQQIKTVDEWELSITDGSAYNGDTEGLQTYIQQLIEAPFNLTTDYMLRANLIVLNKQDYVLVTTLHHIASDGWSMSIMVKELAELYKAAIENRPAALTALPVQFADFTIWQRTYLQGDIWNKKLQYWKNKLEDVPALQIPTDYPRPAMQSSNGAVIDFVIDKALTDGLKALSHQHGATLFMTLLAAFNALLYRYSGQQDICVGTPIAGRNQQELEGLIGCFINTLALRAQVDGNESFQDLLQQVKATTLEAYEHQEVPFEKVVELTVKERDMSRSSLFQVMLALQNVPPLPAMYLGDVELVPEKPVHTLSMFDVSFTMTETANGLESSVEYCTDLYKEETVQRMIAHYVQLLTSLVKNPEQKIGKLEILSAVEQHQLLFQFNDTTADYPNNKNVIDLFEEQVLRTPNITAVVFEENQLTYLELNERANQLAYFLKTKGVKEETLVPICIERSVEVIVGMLGIIKAGGAYVPIDPNYPLERIDYILDNINAAMMVCSRAVRMEITPLRKLDFIVLDDEHSGIDLQPKNNLQTNFPPHQLAYIIYTSGSTGTPKGVLVEHHSLFNITLSWRQHYHLDTIKPVLFSIANIAFDVFTGDWCRTLTNGGKMIIANGRNLNIEDLYNVLKRNAVNIMESTPYLVDNLIKYIEDGQRDFSFMRLLIIGSDILNAANYSNLLERYGHQMRIINSYGTTEATIDSSYFEGEFKKTGITPIGKPLTNTQLYILNKEEALCPVGINGEIGIGGAGVSRGYLKLPELTAAKFVANPFRTGVESKIYKTGDLGRWLPDGNIEYLGRIDTQVKVRGYRIELGEIESVLQNSGMVSQGVVLVKADSSGNSRLVGYVVSEGLFNRDAVMSYLDSKLPFYMVPSVWIEMERLPITSNGKIDKNALPDIDAENSVLLKTEYVAPRTETEKQLVEIWKELLQAEVVGINDDFFDLGGHSLLAMRMAAHIENKLSLSIPVKVLFRFTRISDLSKYLEVETVSMEEDNATVYNVYDI